MKKVISIMMCVMLLCFDVALADENHNITNKLNEIWLSPEENIRILENIKKINEAKIEELINLYSITPKTYRQKIGISADDEKMKEQVRKSYEVYPNNILKVYYLNKNDYAKQYADSNCLEYLISDDYFLIMKGFDYKFDDNSRSETVTERSLRYGYDGTMEKYEQIIDKYGYSGGLVDGYCEFLENSDEIKSVLNQINVSHIEDMKVVVTGKESTCLYIKTSNEEYLIRLYTGLYYNSKSDNPYNKKEQWIEKLELFKLYNAKDFFETVSDEMDEMNSTKQTFETEALKLQENGLLYGNEKGLDLLKPLTRIEAATMILRALGESTTNKTTTQTFADVPATHWGYGAAENAYSLGLIKGVGDDMFAPDDIVTGTQFATMVLRAGNHADFNWEEALDILVSESVISTDDAATMDFFTRGDMAKIIYEARAKGLLN